MWYTHTLSTGVLKTLSPRGKPEGVAKAEAEEGGCQALQVPVPYQLLSSLPHSML